MNNYEEGRGLEITRRDTWLNISLWLNSSQCFTVSKQILKGGHCC